MQSFFSERSGLSVSATCIVPLQPPEVALFLHEPITLELYISMCSGSVFRRINKCSFFFFFLNWPTPNIRISPKQALEYTACDAARFLVNKKHSSSTCTSTQGVVHFFTVFEWSANACDRSQSLHLPGSRKKKRKTERNKETVCWFVLKMKRQERSEHYMKLH